MSDDVITATELQRRVDIGAKMALLDIRNRDEIDVWKIEGPNIERVEVPYIKFVSAQVTGDVTDLLPDAETPVVVVCPHGEASNEVAMMLREAGIDAINLAGGMEAYARVYETTELPTEATVLQYRRPSSGCLAYLIVSGDEALVVDPLRAFTDRYAVDASIYNAELRYAVDTHIHADHISGVRDVAKRTGATPLLSARAVDRGVTFNAESVVDGDTIQVGRTAIEVVATPGHTTGMMSLLIGETLLTGDGLFVDGVPRPDLQAGDAGAVEYARELHRTCTERLEQFDDETLIAPGHYTPGGGAVDGATTARLGELRDSMLVFDADRELFVDRVLASMPPQPANFETIIETNLGQTTLSDDQAFEVELGPNNCATTAD
jgi:thiosulfate/3-mercaptopyruvate sulfurtransferase